MSDSKKHAVTTGRHGTAANVVYITQEAEMKQRRLVDLCNDEIAWFGVVDKTSSGMMVVTDLIVPKQEVSGGSVDYDEDWMHQMLEEYADIITKIRFFGHSHVNMGVGWSGTDTNEFMAKIGEIPGMDYFICHVRTIRKIEFTKIQ